MKTRPESEDSSFDEAFDRTFDFAKAVENPYTNHAREAMEREEREPRDVEQHGSRTSDERRA